MPSVTFIYIQKIWNLKPNLQAFILNEKIRHLNVWFSLISVLRPFNKFKVISGAVS